YRYVRKHPNPDTSRALHVARECAPRRLDLPRGDALRLDRLQPILTERKVDGAGGDAMYAPLVRLAEFGSHRLQHELRPSRLRHLRSITPRPGAAGRPRLRPCAYPAPSDRAP